MDTLAPLPRHDAGRTIRYDLGRLAPVDEVLVEARRLRAGEMDCLLRAAGHRLWQILVSLVAPAFRWNRHYGDPRLRDRQASLAGYIKSLRVDAETAQTDRWLGRGA
jgi:hypothetical protein